MRGSARSSNPYFSGIRPRTFFAARLEMLRRDQMLSKATISADSEKKVSIKAKQN